MTASNSQSPHPSSTDSSSSSEGICHICHSTCRPLKCTQCQSVAYCSRNCQKKHWKAGHREACKAQAALAELKGLAMNLPLQEAQKHYFQTKDALATNNNDLDTTPLMNETTDTGVKNHPLSHPNWDVTQTQLILPTKASKTQSPPTIHKKKDANDYFSFVIEDMRHISKYQLTLTPSQSESSSTTSKRSDRRVHPPSDIQVEILPSESHINSTIIRIFNCSNHTKIFELELPRKIVHSESKQQTVVQADDTGNFQLQLEYQGDPSYQCSHFSEQRLDSSTINSIQCRFCHLPLLVNNPIERVLPLPAGHWEEIADYLICYSGQPVIEFSASAEAKRSIAMQDSNVMCLHKDDFGPSVCILAVDGYGEGSDTGNSVNTNSKAPSLSQMILDESNDTSAAVRGARTWRDAVGGATICCSQCCSPLGFASLESPETYRLLNHRLSSSLATSESGITAAPVTSCASFVARELVRYAESKAIFTFIVSTEKRTKNKNGHLPQCLLLRLLSWDTAMAWDFEADPSSRCKPKFRRVAKIVYEVTNDKLSAGHNNNDSDDITTWVWGGVDLCCTPDGRLANNEGQTNNNGDEQVASTVRLQLPVDEWDEVSTTLQETSLFSKAVVDATILIKLGQIPSETDNVGLAAIPLD